MRILILDNISSNYREGKVTGGMEKVALNLARYLPNATLFTTPSDWDFPFPVRFHSLPYIKDPKERTKAYKDNWYREISEAASEYDVIFNNALSPAQFNFVARLKEAMPEKKVLNYVHMNFARLSFTHFGWLDSIARGALSGVHNIAISQNSIDTALDTIAHKQDMLHVAKENPFHGKVRPYCYEPDKMRLIPEKDHSVCYVTRFDEDKKVGNALAIFKHLKKKDPSLRFDIFTIKNHDPNQPALLASFEKEGFEVKLDRPQAESYEAMGRAKFNFLSSPTEPFSLTVFEAAAFGTPTLVTTTKWHPLREAFPEEYYFSWEKKRGKLLPEDIDPVLDRLFAFSDYSGLAKHAATEFAPDYWAAQIMKQIEKA